MVELDLGKVVMDSYNDLDNKPKINEVELSGNKTLEDLGIQQLIDAVNVSRLSKDVFAPSFETLEDFVAATATDVSVPHFGRMRINTENWGFGTRQIRYLIAYMKAYTVGVLDVLGSGIFWDDTNTMWHVAIHGSIGDLHIQYYKIEPNQIPTNNLLATVAGTPLDAVQGKVLKGQIGDYTLSPSVIDSNTSYGIRTIFGTISNNSGTDSITQHFKDIGFSSTDKTFQELLELICQGSNRREFIKIALNMNNTVFNKSLPVNSPGTLEIYRMEQRRCVIKLNYLSGTEYLNNYMDGTLGTWEMLATVTELKNWLKLIYNHKEYISWTSIASGSYAAGEKRYTKTDIGLIKELLFVFQENSVYESMAYEYVSITTGYGNLTTGYYQAQTTKGLFRIYYSEEGYIDIREVPNGLGIRAALYLPKI